MNVELWTSWQSYDIIDSLELPTLPVVGQFIRFLRSDAFPEGRRFKVIESEWNVFPYHNEDEINGVQGVCIVEEVPYGR